MSLSWPLLVKVLLLTTTIVERDVALNQVDWGGEWAGSRKGEALEKNHGVGIDGTWGVTVAVQPYSFKNYN